MKCYWRVPDSDVIASSMLQLVWGTLQYQKEDLEEFVRSAFCNLEARAVSFSVFIVKMTHSGENRVQKPIQC